MGSSGSSLRLRKVSIISTITRERGDLRMSEITEIVSKGPEVNDKSKSLYIYNCMCVGVCVYIHTHVK